jgi:excinuclease ABC subunit C
VLDSKAVLSNLPDEPGVYRFLDAAGTVLYVGKAKSLKKRVASYFQRAQPSARIQLMVEKVGRVETSVTRSEAEALLLENNLIKTLTPRFNILYRDDKSYPYIKFTGAAFPQIAFHRGAFDKSCLYFGPFPNAGAVRESIQLLQKLFLLRTCENSVFQSRSRPCLLHQIRRCTAPCVGRIGAEDYAADVRMAELFLGGRHVEILDKLTEKMDAASRKLDFERAAVLRDQIRSLQKVLHRQYISSDRELDLDIIAVVEDAGLHCVNLAMVRGGRHLGDRPHFPQNALHCTAGEALVAFVDQHYLDHPTPRRVIVNHEVAGELQVSADMLAARDSVLVRARSESERAWIEMAEKNAKLAIQAQLRDHSRVAQRLASLQEVLAFSEPPGRIECFDISHIMGEAAVASCVVFAEHELKRSEYRRYNISGIPAGDDYAAMRQVLSRRYEKIAAGEGVCPDLVLIDGGKGQVAIAREVMTELGLESLLLIGVAKGEARKAGEEELVFADGRRSLRLGAADPALHLIQEIRDEAHRFALSGHRARRAKARRVSRLEEIPGIGPMRRKRLLAQFGGMQGVVAATVEDLCRVDGINRTLAEQIHSRLH